MPINPDRTDLNLYIYIPGILLKTKVRGNCSNFCFLRGSGRRNGFFGPQSCEEGPVQARLSLKLYVCLFLDDRVRSHLLMPGEMGRCPQSTNSNSISWGGEGVFKAGPKLRERGEAEPPITMGKNQFPTHRHEHVQSVQGASGEVLFLGRPGLLAEAKWGNWSLFRQTPKSMSVHMWVISQRFPDIRQAYLCPVDVELHG